MDTRIVENSRASIIDYNMLTTLLKDLKAPHRKITTLLSSKNLIRVKKGLYVLGERYRKTFVSREVLANLIYGPSYISQEYALQFHGLIPEGVATVTSMTTKRNKSFATPFGNFIYSYLNKKKFCIGISYVEISEDIWVLIASPEKAIIDTIMQHKSISNPDEMRAHLVENLRIELDELKKLNLDAVKEIAKVYHHPIPELLYETLIRRL